MVPTSPPERGSTLDAGRRESSQHELHSLRCLSGIHDRESTWSKLVHPSVELIPIRAVEQDPAGSYLAEFVGLRIVDQDPLSVKAVLDLSHRQHFVVHSAPAQFLVMVSSIFRITLV